MMMRSKTNLQPSTTNLHPSTSNLHAFSSVNAISTRKDSTIYTLSRHPTGRAPHRKNSAARSRAGSTTWTPATPRGRLASVSQASTDTKAPLVSVTDVSHDVTVPAPALRRLSAFPLESGRNSLVAPAGPSLASRQSRPLAIGPNQTGIERGRPRSISETSELSVNAHPFITLNRFATIKSQEPKKIPDIAPSALGLPSLDGREQILRMAEQTSVFILSGFSLPGWLFLLNMPASNPNFYLFVPLGQAIEIMVVRVAAWYRDWREANRKRRNQIEPTERRDYLRQVAVERLYDFVGIQASIVTTCAFSALYLSAEANMIYKEQRCLTFKHIPIDVILQRAAFALVFNMIACFLTMTFLIERKVPVCRVALVVSLAHEMDEGSRL
ncbi:hypothetical protein HDU96_008733 [Phlyctochytrium bullatum]|nr:hypothetical protein HDU96_008733 [Phlyctochytrium bullatum]